MNLKTKIIDNTTSFLNRKKSCNCGKDQYKLISTSINGKYHGKKPICKACYYELIKD